MEGVVWSGEGPAGFHMQAWLPHGGLRGSHYWLCLQHSLLLIQEATPSCGAIRDSEQKMVGLLGKGKQPSRPPG